MAYEELDIVRLSDGIEATVLEVFGDHEAYLVEYPVATDELYEQRTVYADDVEKRVSHV